MFVASKLLGFFEEPLFWISLLLLAAVVAGASWPRTARRLTLAALLLVAFTCWTGPPVALLRWLEGRYPPIAADADLRPYAGVVLLGGALVSSGVWTAHGQVALNEQAERMTSAVALLRRHAHLRLLFTGGLAELKPTPGSLSEAQRARIFFDEMGVDPARVMYEDRSRNTYENALLSAALPGIDRSRRWLLLTSANHMPRSMGVFLKTGWNVTPYPVDFRTSADMDWLDFSFHEGPRTWKTVLHEILGLIAYRALDKL